MRKLIIWAIMLSPILSYALVTTDTTQCGQDIGVYQNHDKLFIESQTKMLVSLLPITPHEDWQERLLNVNFNMTMISIDEVLRIKDDCKAVNLKTYRQMLRGYGYVKRGDTMKFESMWTEMKIIQRKDGTHYPSRTYHLDEYNADQNAQVLFFYVTDWNPKFDGSNTITGL